MQSIKLHHAHTNVLFTTTGSQRSLEFEALPERSEALQRTAKLPKRNVKLIEEESRPVDI